MRQQKQQQAEAEAQGQGIPDQGGANDRTANDLIQSVQAGMKLDALAKEMQLKDIDRQKELAHKDAKAAQEIGIIAAKEAAGSAAAKRK